eukprot:Nk52_evm8s1762 gene=Nk52_evmTU8s1762
MYRKRVEENRPIRYKTSQHNCVFDVAKARGWQEVKDEGEWDLYWADVSWVREYFDNTHMGDNVKLNHFRNHYELTRKNLIVKNLKRLKKQVEREHGKEEANNYDFFPATFELPQEYALFVEEFKKNQGEPWIMKPVGKAQGKGIFLFNKLNQITEWKKDYRLNRDREVEKEPVEAYIAQKYINNPYLIGGRKFDLRIYVLVTSYSPLVIWLYRSGFARFSNTRFSMDKKEIDNNYVHLTNVAIQKTSSSYDTDKGCKWMLSQLKKYLICKHSSAECNALFLKIEDIIVKSLLSVQKTMINDKHCFELYGYDILIDDNLKPWLLEVNASPSLTADTSSDYRLKSNLLDDTFSVIDMEKELTGNEKHIGGYDLIWNDGSVIPPTCSDKPVLGKQTYLGSATKQKTFYRGSYHHSNTSSSNSGNSSSANKEAIPTPSPGIPGASPVRGPSYANSLQSGASGASSASTSIADKSSDSSKISR